MRVLHVVTTLGIGGVERMLLALLPAWRAQGIETAIAFLKPPTDLRAEFERAGVATHALEMRHWGHGPRAMRSLRRLALEGGFDLVHSHLLQGDLLTRCACAGVLPQVRAQHNIERVLRHGSVRFGYRRLLARRSPLVTPTAVVRDFALRMLGEVPAGVHVIPYGIALDSAFAKLPRSAASEVQRAEWGVAHDQRVALVLARQAPQKGQLELLRALRSVPCDTNWTWVFVGGSSQRRYAARLTRELASHPWRAHVRMRPAAMLPECALQAADALCIPSRWEGFGLVALEAMRGGIPIVAHDLAVLREVLADTALFVPLFDGAAWMRALDDVHRDRARTTARCLAAYQRVRTHFSLEVMRTRLRTLYEQTISAR